MIREVRRYQQEEKEIADQEEEEEDEVAEEAGEGVGDDDEEEDPYQEPDESINVVIMTTTNTSDPNTFMAEDAEDGLAADRLERMAYGRRPAGVKHSVSSVTDPGFFTDPPVRTGQTFNI